MNSPEEFLFQGWSSVAAIRLSLRVYSVKAVSMKKTLNIPLEVNSVRLHEKSKAA